MAFQGAQNQPDLVGLALNLMQMRRDRELAERKMALEEFNAVQKARTDAAQAYRDSIKFDLDMQKSRMELDEKQNTKERGLATQIETVNNPSSTPEAAYAAARDFDRSVMSQVDAGRSPEQIGGNVGAELSTRESARQEKYGTEVGKARALIAEKKRLDKAIRDGESSGDDVSSLKEERALISQIIQNKGKGANVNVNLPGQVPDITGTIFEKNVANISSANAIVSRIDEAASDIKSGQVKVGPAGLVTVFGMTARGLAEDIAAYDASQGTQDLANQIADNFDEKTGRISIKTDRGKQLNLTLGQLELAWDFVKMKRESARFTVLELETALRQLDLTGLTMTRDKALGALAKIKRAAFESRNQSEAVLNSFGFDPKQYSGIGTLTPEQQREIESMRLDPAQASPNPVSTPAIDPRDQERLQILRSR